MPDAIEKVYNVESSLDEKISIEDTVNGSSPPDTNTFERRCEQDGECRRIMELDEYQG